MKGFLCCYLSVEQKGEQQWVRHCDILTPGGMRLCPEGVLQSMCAMFDVDKPCISQQPAKDERATRTFPIRGKGPSGQPTGAVNHRRELLACSTRVVIDLTIREANHASRSDDSHALLEVGL